MGIRITIRMGYGLTDVKCNGYELADPRINSKSPLLDYEAKTSVDDYREFLKSKNSHKTDGFAMEAGFLNPDHWMGKGKKPVDIFDCVTHRTEYGIPEVLCITPAWLLKDWRRYDDSIDYALSTHVYHTNPEDKVWPLDYGHYPYNGIYMDKRTGERVKDSIIMWVRMLDGGKRGRWKVKKQLRSVWDTEGRVVMDALAQAGGFKDHEDAFENCRPVVPEEVRNLAAFGGLFTDPSVVNQLRPMIYQYWG